MCETAQSLRDLYSQIWAPASGYHLLQATAHTCQRKSKKREYGRHLGQIRQIPKGCMTCMTSKLWIKPVKAVENMIHGTLNIIAVAERINKVSAAMYTMCIVCWIIASQPAEIQEPQI